MRYTKYVPNFFLNVHATVVQSFTSTVKLLFKYYIYFLLSSIGSFIPFANYKKIEKEQFQYYYVSRNVYSIK